MAAGGCQGLVAQAPFTVRPDTTVPGSLLGPFDGQVVDQATGNPISGALIVGAWALERNSVPVPVSAYSASTQTQNDGSYHLDRISSSHLLSAGAVLRRFTLVVYKAGYIGYRSDLRYDDRSPRHDFAQRDNKIHLDRFPEGESHARHLLFLGANGPLRRVAQAEIVQASLELLEKGPQPEAAKEPTAEEPAEPAVATTTPAPPAQARGAAALLTMADIKEWAAQPARPPRAFAVESLSPTLIAAGMEPADDSVHYRAQGLAESHDGALQIWRRSSGAAAAGLYNKLKALLGAPQLRDAGGRDLPLPLPPERVATTPLPDLVEPPPLRDAAGQQHQLPPAKTASQRDGTRLLQVDATLRAYDRKLRIYGIVALLRNLGMVLKLTCGADLCKNEEAAARLMARVLSRL